MVVFFGNDGEMGYRVYFPYRRAGDVVVLSTVTVSAASFREGFLLSQSYDGGLEVGLVLTLSDVLLEQPNSC